MKKFLIFGYLLGCLFIKDALAASLDIESKPRAAPLRLLIKEHLSKGRVDGQQSLSFISTLCADFDQGPDWRVLHRVFPFQTGWSGEEWWTFYEIERDDLSATEGLTLAFNNPIKVGDFTGSSGCDLSLSLTLKKLDINNPFKFRRGNLEVYVFDERAILPIPLGQRPQDVPMVKKSKWSLAKVLSALGMKTSRVATLGSPRRLAWQ